MQWKDRMFTAVQEYAKANAMLAVVDYSGAGSERSAQKRINESWQKVALLIYEKEEGPQPASTSAPT